MNAVETLYHFEGFHGCQSECGLSVIRLPDGRTAVICTELPNNKGTSITNFAEDLAGLVCTEHGINPAKLVWIEHYPPDDSRTGLRHGKPSWDLVTFAVALHDGKRVVFEQPQWRPMREADWRELGLTAPPIPRFVRELRTEKGAP